MTSTPYEQRVDLIKKVIVSNAKLDDKKARELSASILDTLNSIPEKMR